MAKSLSISLAWRAPNPPARFAGRADELGRFRQQFPVHRALAISGLRGIGKSTFVAAALAELDVRERTLWVALPSATVAIDARSVPARALGEHVQGAPTLGVDPRGDVAWLVDTADAHGLVVVVDDADRADPESLADLIRTFATYARRATLIVVSRESVGIDADASVVLGPLPAAAMLAVALSLLPPAREADAATAVASAAGVPGRLRAISRGEEPEGLELEGDALAAAAELALSPLGLPRPLFEQRFPHVAPQLDRWVRRGIAGYHGPRVALTDPARALVQAQTSVARPDIDALLDALLAERSTVATVSALAIIAASRLADRVTPALRVEVASQIATGHALDIWTAIGASPDPELEPMRLACAATLGHPAVLRAVTEPSGDDPRARLDWARVLQARGELERARAAALDAAARFDDPRSADEARWLAALYVAQRGDMAQAAAELAAIAPPDLALAARRDALLSLAAGAAESGVDVEAKALALRAFDATRSLDAKERDAVERVLLQAAYRQGDLRLALRVLDARGAPTRAPVATTLDDRRARLSEVAVEIQLGRLDAAEANVEAVLRVEARSTYVAAAALGFQAEIELMAGRRGDALQAIRDVRARATAMGARGVLANATYLELSAAIALGESSLVDADLAGFDPQALASLSAVARRAQRRFGKEPTTTLGSAATRVAPAHPRAALLWCLAELEERSFTDLIAARVDAERLADRAREEAYGWIALDALALVAECSLLLDDRPAARDAARAMKELAHQCASPRYRADAEWLAWAAEDSPELSALEPLAARLPVPTGAGERRARWWLGVDASLDAFDERIVAALSKRGVARAELVRGASAGEPRWGVDVIAKTVWDSERGPTSLAHAPSLWSVLFALVDAGGAATKERLVRDVWGFREYHPLRHDGRLRAAIRNLRDALGDAPPHVRIVTTSDGYALGGTVRVRR